jgi:Carboxypeptidase regulatory-like domain
MRMNCVRTLSLVVGAGLASAQTGDFGGMTGILTDPQHAPVPNIPVQMKNTKTGTVYNAAASANGGYSFKQLPAGTYDLLVPAVGFTLDKFEQKGLVVGKGQTLKQDIQMPWGANLGTPGDDPSIFIRNKYAKAPGPAPRTADGKPDLSGVWNGNDDPNPVDPPMLPWAEVIVKERLANSFRDSPSGFCEPGGPLLTGPLLYKFVQTPKLIVNLMEDAAPFRQVYMDGRAHPKNLDPTWMGHSIGHWEGDTLVVDTVGLNDKSWLNIYPHTEQLHLTERYKRPDFAHLLVEITIDDPGTFTKPWVIRNTWNLAPGEDILEYQCENNRDAVHLSAK